jgi:hypothetical protein
VRFQFHSRTPGRLFLPARRVWRRTAEGSGPRFPRGSRLKGAEGSRFPKGVSFPSGASVTKGGAMTGRTLPSKFQPAALVMGSIRAVEPSREYTLRQWRQRSGFWGNRLSSTRLKREDYDAAKYGGSNADWASRQTSTGMVLWVSTLTVSLPSTIAEMPRRP